MPFSATNTSHIPPPAEISRSFSAECPVSSYTCALISCTMNAHQPPKIEAPLPSGRHSIPQHFHAWNRPHPHPNPPHYAHSTAETALRPAPRAPVRRILCSTPSRPRWWTKCPTRTARYLRWEPDWTGPTRPSLWFSPLSFSSTPSPTGSGGPGALHARSADLHSE